MAYQKGDLITAANFNTFRNTVSNVYGTGTGDRGYGQTPLIGAITTGTTISSSHWTALRTMLTTCATHQGTLVTNLPPATEFAAAQIIEAHEQSSPSLNAYDLDSYVSAIDTNRLTAAAGNLTTSAVVHTVTRGSAWGGATQSITCTIDVGFGSEDAARYFFNTGGKVRLRLSHSASGTSQDTEWVNITSRLGTVLFGAHNATSTGSSGLSGAVGFYELTNTATLIINGTSIGSGAYASNDVLVYAQRLNYVGTNGGNGNGVRFTVTLNDDHTNAFSDTVSSGTTLSFEHTRATYLSGIATPTYTTVSGWA